MAVSWGELRRRVYAFCDLSSTRASEDTVDGWISRAISEVCDLAESHPLLWDSLIFLEKISEATINSSHTVELPSGYMKLHKSCTVRGRPLRLFLSVPNRQRVRDEIAQPTVDEPWAVIWPNDDNNESRETRSIRIYPSKFSGEKVIFRYLEVPDKNESFSDDISELLVAKASLIALEEFPESERVQLALRKYGEALTKFGVGQ